jgi:hypothetical protein
MLALLICSSACNREDPESCTPVRAPTGSVVTGDSNADGVVDLADVVGYRDFLFAGGAEPACPAAAEVLGFEAEAGNLWTTLSYAFDGKTIVDSGPACALAERSDDVCAGSVELVPTSRGIELRGVDEEGAVQAWSFGVEAEGCTITAATVAGTAGALEIDGGHRRGGYEHTVVKDGRAVTGVLLDGFARKGLPKGEHVLLAIEYDDCAACTVRVVDGVKGSGRPVPAVVVIDGKAVVPKLGEATFERCP